MLAPMLAIVCLMHFRRALADFHHRDHRRDADDDAQRRQNRSEGVALNGVKAMPNVRGTRRTVGRVGLSVVSRLDVVVVAETAAGSATSRGSSPVPPPEIAQQAR